MKGLILSFLLAVSLIPETFCQNKRLALAPQCTTCGNGEIVNYFPSAIYNTIWKVDEMFINDVPVKDSIAYQIRFAFAEENNLVICYGSSSANMFQWDFDTFNRKILFWNHDRTRKLDEFSVYSVDPFVLILKSNKKDKYTNADAIVEYRLLTDNTFVIPE